MIRRGYDGNFARESSALQRFQELHTIDSQRTSFPAEGTNIGSLNELKVTICICNEVA